MPIIESLILPSVAKFVVTNVVTIMIPLWGMVGLWTQKFGLVSIVLSANRVFTNLNLRFHNEWEFWYRYSLIKPGAMLIVYKGHTMWYSGYSRPLITRFHRR